MYLEIFLADFAVFHDFWEFRGILRKYLNFAGLRPREISEALILVTLLKIRPHYSQSSHENATPSSRTSPSASYKEVYPPSPPPMLFRVSSLKQGIQIISLFIILNRVSFLDWWLNDTNNSSQKINSMCMVGLKHECKQNESGSQGKVCCLKQGQDLKALPAHPYPNRS